MPRISNSRSFGGSSSPGYISADGHLSTYPERTASLMYRQGVEPSTHAFGLVGLLGKHDLLWQMPSYKLMNMTKGQVPVSIADMNLSMPVLGLTFSLLEQRKFRRRVGTRSNPTTWHRSFPVVSRLGDLVFSGFHFLVFLPTSFDLSERTALLCITATSFPHFVNYTATPQRVRWPVEARLELFAVSREFGSIANSL